MVNAQLEPRARLLASFYRNPFCGANCIIAAIAVCRGSLDFIRGMLYAHGNANLASAVEEHFTSGIVTKILQLIK